MSLHFVGAEALGEAMGGSPRTLEAPPGETLHEGEWVLVGVYCACGSRTACAARTVRVGDALRLSFTERDWERIGSFASTLEPVRSARPSEPPTSRHPCFGARVLVIEDDDACRDTLATMLLAVGLVAEAAATVEAATLLAGRTTFDLVIASWSMRGAAGPALLSALQHARGLACAPMLLIAPDGASHEIARSCPGPTDWLTRPFRAPELGARVFGLLRRAHLPPSG